MTIFQTDKWNKKKCQQNKKYFKKVIKKNKVRLRLWNLWKLQIRKEVSDEFKFIRGFFSYLELLDVITLTEKFNSQANEFRSLNDKLKQCAVAAQSVMTFANQNQQYS